MAPRKDSAPDDWIDLAAQPFGDMGLLQRWGDTMVLVATDGDPTQTEKILSVARETRDGRRLVRRLAYLLADDEEGRAPAVVAIAPTESGVAVLLWGDANVRVTDQNGADEVLSGKRSSAWIDRIIDLPLQRIVAHLGEEAGVPADPRLDLLEGVVAASGLVLAPRQGGTPARTARPEPERAASEAPAAVVAEPTLVTASGAPFLLEPAAAAEPEPEFESVLLIDAPSEPAAVVDEAVSEHDDRDHVGPVLVQGIVCKRHHFNSPNAAFCGVCGISMVQQTNHLVEGPRPPLGVLVLDDGTTFRVDDDYVIGREPNLDPDVVAGRARGLTIVDEEGTVSRAHVLLHLDGWDVQLIDRGSANGTFIAPPNTTISLPLRPYDAVTIVPGTRVQVGRRTLIFDAHNRI